MICINRSIFYCKTPTYFAMDSFFLSGLPEISLAEYYLTYMPPEMLP